MNLLLDTGILGQLCHPAKPAFQPVMEWVEAILSSGSGDRVFLPELCDYELRRKLLHLIQKGQSSDRSVQRLDELCAHLEYLPLDTATLRKAAEFWSDSRLRGKPTAPEAALDGDVILAAQAALIDGTIVTTNRKHLSQFVPAWDRAEIVWVYCFVCIRGAVDNQAYDWKDHFMVQDTRGRVWHCRQETTMNSGEEVEKKEILTKLDVIMKETEAMYSKLFSSGYDSTEKTTINCPLTFSPIPLSQRELIEDLSRSLGEDSDDQTKIRH